MKIAKKLRIIGTIPLIVLSFSIIPMAIDKEMYSGLSIFVFVLFWLLAFLYWGEQIENKQ